MDEIAKILGQIMDCFAQLGEEIQAQGKQVERVREESEYVRKRMLEFKKKVNEQETKCNNLSKKVEEQELKIKKLHQSIILSTENANRNGRPPLTDEEIGKIRELISQDHSYRDTAERVGCSVGSVHKYAHQDSIPQPKPNTSSQMKEMKL